MEEASIGHIVMAVRCDYEVWKLDFTSKVEKVEWGSLLWHVHTVHYNKHMVEELLD